MKHFAYCDRTGTIDFGTHLPEGRLPIATVDHNQALLREAVEPLARRAYDNETLLVPGIPEADSPDQAIAALVTFRERVAKAMGAGQFDVGQILYSSWGYDQTNVDFYRIEQRRGNFVTLQELESAESSDGAQSMTGRVVPLEPHQARGEPIRRKVHAMPGTTFVKINSYAFAYPWDGTPKRVSHYA